MTDAKLIKLITKYARYQKILKTISREIWNELKMREKIENGAKKQFDYY